MKNTLAKFAACFIVVCLVSARYPSQTRADDRNYNHIHVRGKITTPGGQPVSGAKLIIATAAHAGAGSSTAGDRLAFVVGVPNDPQINVSIAESPTIKTNSSGEYSFIVKFIGTAFDIDKVSIDKAKMTWEKEGYFIKPK